MGADSAVHGRAGEHEETDMVIPLKGGMKPKRVTTTMAKMKEREMVMAFGSKAPARASFDPADLIGADPSSGEVWDPAGFTTDISEGRLNYFREAELKHGRVCMAASLGIFVQERKVLSQETSATTR